MQSLEHRPDEPLNPAIDSYNKLLPLLNEHIISVINSGNTDKMRKANPRNPLLHS